MAEETKNEEKEKLDPRLVKAIDDVLLHLGMTDLTAEESVEVLVRLLAGVMVTVAHGDHIEAGKLVDQVVKPQINKMRAYLARGGRAAPRFIHGKRPH